MAGTTTTKDAGWQHFKPQSYWDALDRIHRMKEFRSRYTPLKKDKGFDELSREETAYYVHWRNALLKGKLLEADIHYARLWMVEAADSLDEMDVESFYMVTMLLEERFPELGKDMVMLDLIRHIESHGPVPSPTEQLNLGYQLCMLPLPMNRYVVESFIDDEDESTPDDFELIVFGRAITFLDEQIRNDTGIGLLERISEKRTMGITANFPLRDHDGRFVFEYPHIIASKGVLDLMSGLLRNVCRACRGQEMEDNYEFFEDAIRKGMSETAAPAIPCPYHSYDLSETNGTDERECASVLFQTNPTSVHHDHTVVKRMWDAECPDSNPGYTESLTPDGELIDSDGVRSYYAYWKKNALEGRFIDSDIGYIELFSEEIRNNGSMDNHRKADLYLELERNYELSIAPCINAMMLSLDTRTELPFPEAYMRGNSFDRFMEDMARTNRYGLSVEDTKKFISKYWESLIFTDEDSADILRRFIVERSYELRRIHDTSIPEDLSAKMVPLLDPRYAGSYMETMATMMAGAKYADGYSDENCMEYLCNVLDAINRRIAERKGWEYPWSEDADGLEDVASLIDSCVERHFLSKGRRFEMVPEVSGKLSAERCLKLLSETPVEPCDFVPCGSMDPRPDAFSEEQRRYYVYWRSRLAEGECLPTEIGYINNRLSELIISDSPIGDRIAEIDLMKKMVPSMGRVFDSARSRCLVFSGYLADDIEMFGDGKMTAVCVCDRLSHPPAYIDVKLLENLLYYSEVETKPDPEWTEMFNRMLQTLSSYLVETKGMDIPRMVSRGYEMDQLPMLYHDQNLGRSVDIVHPQIHYDRLMETVRGLADCCDKVIGKKKVKRIRLSWGFTRDMYDAVMSGYRDQSPVSPSAKDRIERRTFDGNGVMIIGQYLDIHTNNDIEPSDVYVRSSENKGYDPRVSAYYRWWVDQVGKGNRPMTDVGYLAKHVIEVGKTVKPQEYLEILEGFRADYDPMDRDGFLISMIAKTCLENGMLLEDSGKDHWIPLAFIVLWQIVSGKGGRLNAGAISYLGDTPSSICGELTEDCLDAINECLAECSRRYGNKLTEFKRRFSIKTCRFYAHIQGVELEYMGINNLEGSTFQTELKGLVKSIASLMRGGNGKVDSFGELKPEEIRGIAKKHKDGRGKPRISSHRKITLDTKAVTDAESDLAHVTEIMRVEDTEEETVREKVTEVPIPASDNPWRNLASLLTDEERNILSSIIMEESSPEIDTRMTDSINSKAMDTVGDVIIENGVLLEDYIGELRSVLGGEARDGDIGNYAELISALTDEEREYVSILSEGGKTKGRRPVKRIESINGKSRRIIGSDLIEDGTIPGHHLDGIRGSL